MREYAWHTSGFRLPAEPLVSQYDLLTLVAVPVARLTIVHQRSAHFNHNTDDHFGQLTVAPNRSFIEACWIKTYNGLRTENGNVHYYYLTPGNRTDGVLPVWLISDYAIWYDSNGIIHYNHYVREIGEQLTPE